jgi:Polyketide cyclase / dehydrase and lipid transport
MYLLASAAITVESTSPEVFGYAADLENFPSWFPGVISITADNELPFATVGKQYRETVAVPLQGKQLVLIRVVDVNPPWRIVTEGDLPILLPRMEIEIQERGPNSCHVHWRMLSRNDSRLARYTLLPVAALLMRRRAKTGLWSLKGLLEASA